MEKRMRKGRGTDLAEGTLVVGAVGGGGADDGLSSSDGHHVVGDGRDESDEGGLAGEGRGERGRSAGRRSSRTRVERGVTRRPAEGKGRLTMRWKSDR